MVPSLGRHPRLPPRLFAIDAPNGTGTVGEATRPVLRPLFLDLFRYGRGQSRCHAGCRCPPPGLCGFGPRCAVPTPARPHGQADEGGPATAPAGGPEPRASVRFGTTGRRGASQPRAPGKNPSYRLLVPPAPHTTPESFRPLLPPCPSAYPVARNRIGKRQAGTAGASHLPSTAGPWLKAPPHRCPAPPLSSRFEPRNQGRPDLRHLKCLAPGDVAGSGEGPGAYKRAWDERGVLALVEEVDHAGRG
jgi:hypothetical protein